MTNAASIDDHELASEQTLVTRAEAGDERAFDELYRRHAPNAWRLSLAVTRNPHDAADVMAESFAKIFTAIRAGRFSSDAPFRPYLLTTARNTAIDLHRSRRRETTGDDPDTGDTVVDLRTGADPLASLEAGEDARLIASAFTRLPERWRSVLWLSAVEGLKPKDIAPIVGLSPNATSQLAVRARQGLREQYLQAHVARSKDRNCSRAVSRLGAYVAGTLGPSDTEKVERHLGLCETCTDRHRQLTDVGSHLRLFALPLPLLLVDQVRATWAAAVVTSPDGSGTGLSATAEKVIAGVSAAAAAVGVFGAALLGTPSSTPDESAAPRTAAPIALEAPTPVPFDLDEGVDLPSSLTADPAPAASTTPASGPAGGPANTGSVNTGSANTGSANTGSANTTGSSTAGPAPATDPSGPALAPASPAVEAPTAPVAPKTQPSQPEASDADPEPVVKVSTTVAGVPVAVEVGEEPGVAIGSQSAGSKPAPEEDEPVIVGGPLAPAAAVVESVTEPVAETPVATASDADSLEL